MSDSNRRITIARPDDWHVHFRDGPALADTVPFTARRFARAIVMPNLAPPVITTDQALAYRERILSVVPEDAGAGFEPLMTLYLTDETTPEEIRRAASCEHVHGVKLYPAGATTNSAAGVTDYAKIRAALAAMEREDLVLLVHGEVVDPSVDAFDRERIYIDRVFEGLVRDFPGLRIVFEHVTTREAVDFVREGSHRVAATITAHHLLLNRNALFEGGLRPHHYCVPLLKREHHRQALVEAATSGHPRFFLGTDSAPHPRGAKESGCGCAGLFTAAAGIELYAEAFDAAGALARLEDFASGFGADFYGLARNRGRLGLEAREWTMSPELAIGDDSVVPMRAGGQVAWALV